MEKLYELKEMLCDELEKYGKEDKLTAGSLDVIDKLSHTIKNIDKILEKYEEEGYSREGYSRGDGRNYNITGTYARGRMNARRDARGRYSNASDMVDRLHDIMADAPDEHMRHEIQKLITKVESM